MDLFVKVGPNGVKPTRATSKSAGFDLYAAQDQIVYAKLRECIPTDIVVYLPENHYGRIASRSSLSRDYGLEVGAGIIDNDYLGEIKIMIYNHSNHTYYIEKGAKVAQLIVSPYYTGDIKDVDACQVDESVEKAKRQTERNELGFGSTD